MTRFAHPAKLMIREGEWLSAEMLREFERSGTDAHRVFSSEEGWVERFGLDILISYKNQNVHEKIQGAFFRWIETEHLSFRRVFTRFLPRENSQRSAPVLLHGPADRAPDGIVQENGIHFAVDFASGYSVGLFLDQRANRAFLRRSGAKRLLNTFAYTCSFSVAAALNGAQTISVDLSQKSLDRGKNNFLLNRLNPAEHQFRAADVLEWLPRLARKGEKFDAIVLDPPTFSRGHKGRRFQVEHDFEQLLVTALELATRDARVCLSTNCLRFSNRALETMARYCLRLTRRTATLHREPELVDIPEAFAARSLWLLLK